MNTFTVQITPHAEKEDWYIASYESGFLSARYSVEFPNSITGAIALHHFVEMLKTRHPQGRVRPMHEQNHDRQNRGRRPTIRARGAPSPLLALM